MATDNRTQLNNCDQDTDAWAGDSSTADNTESGNVYEGAASQGATLSNALERIVVSTIGGTRDLSDATVWCVVKDSLASSQAAGGFQIVLDDGSFFFIMRLWSKTPNKSQAALMPQANAW